MPLSTSIRRIVSARMSAVEGKLACIAYRTIDGQRRVELVASAAEARQIIGRVEEQRAQAAAIVKEVTGGKIPRGKRAA